MTESKPVESNAAATAEPYIGKRELARRLSIKFRTVDSWISRGWIPYYKVGKYVLFKWSEVDAQVSRTFRKANIQ
jgi:excisionase family DNA binding protein